MTHEELVAHCPAEPGAVPDTPWEDDLRLRFPDAVTVSACIGRHGGNTVRLDVGPGPDDELRELVDASCDAVVATLPKRLRP